jgi:peroxiredoxin
MAKTYSTMLPLGSEAPAFSLTDVVTGHMVSLKQSKETQAIVVMFICNHCPFVKYINNELTRVANDYMPLNVQFYAINSNDVSTYPADSPEHMVQTAKEQAYPFPYLYDETQGVAKAYQAACTPDFFVFDKEHKLVYRGQLDNARPGNHEPITGECIRETLDCLLEGRPVTIEQKPSMGCNIKWKED